MLLQKSRTKHYTCTKQTATIEEKKNINEYTTKETLEFFFQIESKQKIDTPPFLILAD